MRLIEIVADPNNLIKSFHKVKKSSGWKYSTQQVEVNLLKYINTLSKSLLDGTYRQSKGKEFVLNEQGKLRVIKALAPQDLIVQHSLCDFVILPAIKKLLIHDSGASLKGKGLSFTRRRFEQHLFNYYTHYGNEGYILKIDFRKFFDNIKHKELIEIFDNVFQDEEIKNLLERILEPYKIDVSYSDNENIIDEVFNSLDYSKIKKELKTGKRYMEKSVGIGSPFSQLAGLFFPHYIDNYCKIVKGIKYCDVYMDDRIIIHNDKEFLKDLLKEIEKLATTIGIHIHKDKTQIIKLSRGFTFLKTKYILTKTGKIIRKIPKDVVVRERRKLKTLARLVKNGVLTKEYFEQQYLAWRGDKRKYKAFHTLQNIDKLYKDLLGGI